MIYWFKRKIFQIKNLVKWFPVIWNQYDFDYHYAIDVFKFQLKKTADYLESHKAYSIDSHDRAKRIRTIIKLMDKVYEEEYLIEYFQRLETLYGKDIFEHVFIDTGRGDGTTYMKFKYEVTKSDAEIKVIDQDFHRMLSESRDKQEKAHRILWKLIERNIRTFWD